MTVKTRGLSLHDELHQFGGLLRGALDVHITVQVDVADGCPDVAVAADALREALVELVANARDAMPDGGKLMLRARPCASSNGGVRRPASGANDWVALSVADTGCGMSVEEREHAADPGFSTKQHARNGGWGLTRATQLARNAGGTLSICSAPGTGTVVTLYLPSV